MSQTSVESVHYPAQQKQTTTFFVAVQQSLWISLQSGESCYFRMTAIIEWVTRRIDMKWYSQKEQFLIPNNATGIHASLLLCKAKRRYPFTCKSKQVLPLGFARRYTTSTRYSTKTFIGAFVTKSRWVVDANVICPQKLIVVKDEYVLFQSALHML